MKTARFFVTFVASFFTLAFIACTGGERDKTIGSAGFRDRPVVQGNEKLALAFAVERDLNAQSVYLEMESYGPIAAKAKDIVSFAEGFNWLRVGKPTRDRVNRDLRQYIILTNQALELGSQKGYYVNYKEKLIAKKEAAYAFQRSIDEFENLHGVNFDPKPDPTQPLSSGQSI